MGAGGKDYKISQRCTLCGMCAESARRVCGFFKVVRANFLARPHALIIP